MVGNRDGSSMGGRKVRVEREDFELACIREFSHSGHQLGSGVSRAERRERIKTAILREDKADQRWQDSDFSYAQVYAHVFQQPLTVGDSYDKNPADKGFLAWRSEMAEDDEGFDDESAGA